MSSTFGWIEHDGIRIDFPFIPHRHGVWNQTIIDWCNMRHIAFEYVDPLWVTATVTKDQIDDFIGFVYKVSICQKDRFEAQSIWEIELHHRDMEKLRLAVANLPINGIFLLAGFDH